MKRSFWKILNQWKNAPRRKPMLVQGARQVGKIWILKQFGETQFAHCILLDFAENRELNGFFKPNLKPDRILTELGLYLGADIDLKDTLLIFDEIQLCPDWFGVCRSAEPFVIRRIHGKECIHALPVRCRHPGSHAKDSSVLYQYDVGQFKGFLAENAVLNELACGKIDPIYTWREGSAEIEFITSSNGLAVPIEVKAGINTKAKSMRVFRHKYEPELAVLLTAQGANQQDNGLLHAPLYLASYILS